MNQELRTFSGTLGIVALLNRVTCKSITEPLIAAYAQNADYTLGDNPPHITLYHGPMCDVPDFFAQEVLETVAECAPSFAVTSQLTVFRDKFLFLDMYLSMSRMTSWRAPHYVSMSLARFLDREAVATALATRGENIKLDARQNWNNATFGHPLVGSSHQPHLTLAYAESGITLPESAKKAVEGLYVRVTHIALVRIGKYGAVQEVLMENEC